MASEEIISKSDTKDGLNYVKTDLPLTTAEWLKRKGERKALKRERKEQKLNATIDKKIENVKAAKMRKLNEQEELRLIEKRGRAQTISIALPGSILDNAQSPELRTYLAGQIARAAVVFNVDEIIIFDETGNAETSTEGEYAGVGKKGHANVQLARILQYLECPQYLRKSFFPQHKDLQYAGLLNPLDCFHHMRTTDECTYREGVVLDKPVKAGKGSLANVGLYKEVEIDRVLRPGIRVTVKLEEVSERKHRQGTVVAPSVPRTNEGLYWGYSVRLALSLGAVFTDCPYKHGYDLTIGTSEKGTHVDSVTFSKFRHALVVFGGLGGLESCLDFDTSLAADDPSELFKHYINTCPDQGSKTIRTEEAILISLSVLRPKLTSLQRKHGVS